MFCTDRQIYLTNVKYQKTYDEEDKLFQCFNRNYTRGVNSRYGNLSLKFARVYYKVCRCNKFARRILRLKAFIIRYRKWKCFPFFFWMPFLFLLQNINVSSRNQLNVCINYEVTFNWFYQCKMILCTTMI